MNILVEITLGENNEYLDSKVVATHKNMSELVIQGQILDRIFLNDVNEYGEEIETLVHQFIEIKPDGTTGKMFTTKMVRILPY